MDSILIVSGASKDLQDLSRLLQSGISCRTVSALSGADARRQLIGSPFDIVIINSPLLDEFGHELALFAAGATAAGILMAVKASLADAVSGKVEDSGVFVVEKPLNRRAFFQSLKLVSATHRRMLGLQRENEKLLKKIEEIRLVDRAKCLLIQYQGMTEGQAHRHLEKQAMDQRITRREIAQNILDEYESGTERVL